jgi:hypothetical protein
MKLELKHLAPYLPYKLKVELLNFDMLTKMMGIKEPNEEMRFSEMLDLSSYKKLNLMYKPVLRPLSDLYKEIEIDGYSFNTPIEYISSSNANRGQIAKWISKDLISNLQYWQIERLLELHFDIFGLIEADLAHDINKIQKIYA